MKKPIIVIKSIAKDDAFYEDRKNLINQEIKEHWLEPQTLKRHRGWLRGYVLLDKGCGSGTSTYRDLWFHAVKIKEKEVASALHG